MNRYNMLTVHVGKEQSLSMFKVQHIICARIHGIHKTVQPSESIQSVVDQLVERRHIKPEVFSSHQALVNFSLFTPPQKKKT